MKAYGDIEVYLFSLISALYIGGQSASSLARFNPEDKGLSFTLGIGGRVPYRGGFGGSNSYPPPQKISKVLQNHAKINPIVKTINIC